jgi:hypothetical protein
MKIPVLGALALSVSACSAAPLPDLSPTDAAHPEAPVVATPYQPVMAGTAAHMPVGLRSWRELNESVTPGGGRTP